MIVRFPFYSITRYTCAAQFEDQSMGRWNISYRIRVEWLQTMDVVSTSINFAWGEEHKIARRLEVRTVGDRGQGSSLLLNQKKSGCGSPMNTQEVLPSPEKVEPALLLRHTFSSRFLIFIFSTFFNLYFFVFSTFFRFRLVGSAFSPEIRFSTRHHVFPKTVRICERGEFALFLQVSTKALASCGVR